MSFLIKGNELLKTYNGIWEKVRNSIKKEFESKPVHNGKYLKTKNKILKGKNQHKFPQ